MKAYAYQNSSDQVRFQSSSGGFFTDLAENVLRDRGVVYGASFNANWEVEHRRVVNCDDLHFLRKSKYVFSDVHDTLGDAEKILKEGRKVLFTGTPCQIASLKKRLNRDYDNLLVVEVICHGAPQPKLWKLYLDDLLDRLGKNRSDIIDIDFRDKSNGWESYNFTIKFSDGSVFTEPASQNLYMRLFLKDFIVKRGCFKCPFKHPYSKADITMGDLWGMRHILPDNYDQLGTSVVIANTPKGEELLRGKTCIGELAIGDVVKYNPALVSSPIMPARYDKFNKQLTANSSLHKIGERQLKTTLCQRVIGKISRILCRLSR